ncbi:maltokinase N-terminal cap-like domain-containing protein [Streptomyces misionensis]|uniref:maltokinase N-terminal cap-like domain-containing protein n=1 Tax=Streptomyces misionensis TaxID=67331 RepID=UPI003689E787
MAVIHHTTLQPSKLDLLTEWLPTRPWYRGGADAPVLEKSGGFRLDDPAGEVGIEFMIVTDTAGAEPTVYFVPLTYRGAPLAGAEHALVGTMEHGVLGKRWAYDGLCDPVLVTELLLLVEGKAQAMAQSITDTPDHEVSRAYAGAPFAPEGLIPAPADDTDGTRLPAPHGTVLHIHRVLTPAPADENPPLPAEDALGHVATGWPTPAGDRRRAVLLTLRQA